MPASKPQGPQWSGHEVVGVDPSTHWNGFLELSADGLRSRSHLVNLGKEAYHPGKLLTAYVQLEEFLSTLPSGHRPFVFIEEPVMGQGGLSTTVVQAFISGAYQLVTQRLGLPCRLVNNSAWKARVVGNGKATKQDIAAAIARDWVVTYPGLATVPGISDGTTDQNLLDAAGVAIYGLRGLQQRVKLVLPSGMQRPR